MTQGTKPTSRTPLIILGSLGILLIAAAAALVLVLKQSQDPVAKATPAASSRPKPVALPTFAASVAVTVPGVRKEDIVYNSAEAPILVYEYSDLECPFCRQFHEGTLPSLLQVYGGSLGVVYRYFPLADLHPAAPMEAQVTACVAKQDTATARSLVNLDYQRSPATGNSYTQDQFLDLAAEVGADRSATATCMQAGDGVAKVSTDIADGKSFGVTGTPTFFIVRPKDGYTVKVVGAYAAKDFEQVIDFLMPS